MTSLLWLEIHFTRDSEQSSPVHFPPRQHSCPHCCSKSHGFSSEMAGMKRAAAPPNSYINHFVLLIHLITCKEKASP